MNTTTSTASTTYFNKTFYDRKLLDTAKTRFVHASFGQKRSIPRNNGKRVEFRKYDLFTPSTNALTLMEGVTPSGQSLSQSRVEAEVKQYGAYVEISDLLEMTAYDPVVADSAELLGEQLGSVIEWVTRDAMCQTTNVQYAGGAANRVSLTGSDKLSVNEIRKAVRNLKKNKARPFVSALDGSGRKPHFICICSPDSTYDLQADPCGRTCPSTATRSRSTPVRSAVCSAWSSWRPRRPRCTTRACSTPSTPTPPPPPPSC